MEFPTSLSDITARIDAVNPCIYAKTRNYVSGAVSHLSPYISRGIISTKFIYERLMQRYTATDCERFLSELLWREYFQRIQQHNPHFEHCPKLGNGQGYRSIPSKILRAATGIFALDDAINMLYNNGYIHNHARMYIAGLCTMAGYHYLQPARWMYYHLLDGDVASNFGSWHWVAGLHTGKRYIVSQENINKYSGTMQKGTYIDKDYAALEQLSLIAQLGDPERLDFLTVLPDTSPLTIIDAPVLIYNSYNLDPLWRKELPANRVLLLDPAHFEQYPVSERVMAFILSASHNIKGLQLYIGSFDSLKAKYPKYTYIVKEHPLFNYQGAVIDSRDWLAEDISDIYPSFSKYYTAIKKKYHGKYF